MSAKRKAQLKAKKVRYIAVDTEKDAKTSRQAKKSVMVWDTDKQEIANDNVYDIQKSPPLGQTAKFDALGRLIFTAAALNESFLAGNNLAEK
jgi:hypothetical protein